jgi:hypothetical protein
MGGDAVGLLGVFGNSQLALSFIAFTVDIERVQLTSSLSASARLMRTSHVAESAVTCPFFSKKGEGEEVDEGEEDNEDSTANTDRLMKYYTICR